MMQLRTSSILLSFLVLMGCSVESRSSLNQTAHHTTVSLDEVGQLDHLESLEFYEEEQVAQMMIANDEIASYLQSSCPASQLSCIDDMFYQWERQDGKDRIAFLPDTSDSSWKADPFAYSVEIYEVDFNTGDVYRLSPAGYENDFVVNLLNSGSYE